MVRRRRTESDERIANAAAAEHRVDPVRLGTWIALAIILVVALVFFRRIVFFGEILTGGDVLAAAAIFEDYALERMAAGELPLWNPFIFAGMPFFESMTWSAFVYPSYWIWFVVERGIGIDLPRLFFLFLHYLIAGFGTYFFLRSRNVSRTGAIIAGLGFMISPHLVGLATIGHGGKVLTAAYIPLVLMAAQRVLETGSRRWTAALALFGGLQFLARHVQVSYYTWMVVGLFLIYFLVAELRSGRRPAALGRPVGLLVAGVVLSAALAAVLLIPVRAYSEFSTRAAQGGGMGFEQAVMWSFHPTELMSFLVPSFHGLANDTYWGPMPFNQVSHYFGYSVLALAALAVGLRRNRDTRFLLLLFAMGVFLSFGRYIEPIYRLLYNVLPGFSRFRVPALFLLPAQFAAACLAGHGVHALLSKQRSRKTLIRWAVAVAAVGAVVGVATALSSGALSRSAASVLMAKHAGVPASYLRELGSRAAAMAARDGWILVGIALATGGAVAAAATKKLRGWLALAALAAIVLVDVWIVDAHFMKSERMRPLSSYYPSNQAIEFIKRQSGTFRVAPLDQSFSSNTWMYHRIESVGGYHPAKLRLADDLINKAGLTNLKVMALLNVRYVVGPETLDHPAFETVSPGVHELTYTLPRAYLVGEARTSASDALALRELGVDSYDPLSYAIVQGELPGPVESAEGSTARIVSLEPHEIVVDASIRRPCLLVFSEIYYPPGWRATVNGEEAEIIRANYAFRSVWLPAGEHRVVLEHVAPDLRLGLILTIIAAVIIALLWLAPTRRSSEDPA
ncbi:MAG: YfhO family protein [Candidatus Eisenbacteria bacterium]|nr:YfhO family protein [Candidatus Eisenbacteria bacterium]